MSDDVNLEDTKVMVHLLTHSQLSIKSKYFIAFYFISKMQVRDTSMVDKIARLTPLCICLDALRNSSPGNYCLNDSDEKVKRIVDDYSQYQVELAYKHIFGRIDLTRLKQRDGAGLKTFLNKELSFDRNCIDQDAGYGFEYSEWNYMSKKTYLKYKWFAILSNLEIPDKSKVIVDNVSLADVGYYIDLGYSRFSGSFSSFQLQELYGTDYEFDRSFSTADYVIVDPLTGLFKYNNNDTTNDMDSFGYHERYGDGFEERIIALMWGVAERNFQVMIRISYGRVIPFVPHKMFYFFFPKNLSSKTVWGFPVEDHIVKVLSLGTDRHINPYLYAVFMNALRDYILVNPSYQLDDSGKFVDGVQYDNDGRLSSPTLRRFVFHASKYIPMFSEHNLSSQVLTACLAMYMFTFKQKKENFRVYAQCRARIFEYNAQNGVKIIDIAPVFRNIRGDIEESFANDALMDSENTFVCEANINLPSTVSSFRYLRYGRVCGRDNDLKLFVPGDVFKEYDKQDRMIAHNSTYF